MNTFKKNNSLLIGSIKEQPDFPHNPNNLVLVYDTSLEPANNTVSVPLNGTVNCTINWGDGSSQSYTTTGFKTHTYANPGVYVVQISGTMTQLNYGTGSSATNNKAKLVRCLSFGNVGLTNLNNAFYNCSNLIQCPTSLPTTSFVTNTIRMFYNCSVFNQDIGNWDTATVTTMQEMFFGCSVFNQDIGDWNTSAVTNMQGLFFNCSVFNQNVGSWNTAEATRMQSMFAGCSVFNQDISGWNTTKVINMGGMFQNAMAFNQPIGSWNTAEVTSMQSMFAGQNHAFAHDISGWDIRKVTTMNTMFFGNNWGTSNYDAALIAWSQLISPQSNVSWVVGTNKYSSAAASARNILTNTYNWTISDGGLL